MLMRRDEAGKEKKKRRENKRREKESTHIACIVLFQLSSNLSHSGVLAIVSPVVLVYFYMLPAVQPPLVLLL